MIPPIGLNSLFYYSAKKYVLLRREFGSSENRCEWTQHIFWLPNYWRSISPRNHISWSWHNRYVSDLSSKISTRDSSNSPAQGPACFWAVLLVSKNFKQVTLDSTWYQCASKSCIRYSWLIGSCLPSNITRFRCFCQCDLQLEESFSDWSCHG